MNPNDRELEKQWQAQALDPDVSIQQLDDGRLVMDSGREDEWLVFEG